MAWLLLAAVGGIAAAALFSPHELVAQLLSLPQRTVAVKEISPLPGSTTVNLRVSQGRLLRFDEPVESVFVGDPVIADVRVVAPDLVYIYGKQTGTTNLLAIAAEQMPDGGAEPPRPQVQPQPQSLDSDGYLPPEQHLTAAVHIRVTQDSDPPNEAQRILNPDTQVKIAFFGRRAAVQGHASGIDEAVHSANVAQTYSPPGQPPIDETTIEGAQQVNLRVRFAEVTRNELQSLGIDWQLNVNAGSFAFGLDRGITERTTGVTTEPNLGLTLSAGNFDIDVLIEALQRNGVLTILAEPNLTAKTGETAEFLAGGEIPVPVPQERGELITVEYRPFGVSLKFTPTLITGNRIGMRVEPEVSALSDFGAVKIANFEVPSFTVRRTSTTVELASGQTFAIAGLFQRQLSRNLEKFPILGDVPVLGHLFRSERYRRDESELVILITAYLVEPVRDGRRLATPLDRPRPEESEGPWQASIKDDRPHAQSGLIFK